MYHVQARTAFADIDRYVNVPAMPTEPRVIPVACPFGLTGGIVYVYYIDAPQPALIDTGVAASPGTTIEPALNAAGVSLKDVRWILATHGHWDHIGGAHAARSMAAEGVSLALHDADAELLQSRRAHMRPDGYQALRFRYLDDMSALGQQDALLMENLSGELAADRSLHGGERISLGGDVSVEVVHTPGHSPGSASFVISGVDWAFTGDGVQVCGGGAAGFPLYVDPLAYGATQKRLLEDVRPKRLHMGHRFRALDGSVLESVLDGPQVERALKDSLAMHERVVAAARSVVNIDLAQPKAAALEPAAHALGVTGEPATWPPSFFTTLHGHLARAAATA
jgi:glyoxylase-like metal-dependent hydrolase (beta-lactamase superfamily II)